MALNDRSKIVEKNIEEEMKTSYIDYSMSVIVSRALPDVRDGLKPSQRRILVAMNDLNLAPGRPVPKVRQDRRRHVGQLSPARRAGGVPDAGAPGPGLGDALPAGGRAGQLRLDRRRRAGRHAIHRGAPDAARGRDAGRPREEHRRFPSQLRRDARGADRAPGRAAEPAGQRLLRHRGRHGHRSAAAQPHRDLRGDHPGDRASRDHAPRSCSRSSPVRIFRPAASSTAGRASATAT